MRAEGANRSMMAYETSDLSSGYGRSQTIKLHDSDD